MFISTLILATVVAAEPKPSAAGWVTPYDYPRSAARDGRSGVTEFRLTVSTAGKPISCEIERSSGSTDLDDQTCSLIMRRARLTPAKDVSGNAAFGVYRSANTWWTGDGPPPSFPVVFDLAVTLREMPAGFDGPVRFLAAFSVALDGTMSNCSSEQLPRPSRGAQAVVQPAALSLGEMACAQVLQKWKPTPAVDADGVLVPSVQMARVMFRTAAP